MYSDPKKFSLNAKILPRRGGSGVDFGAAGQGVERVNETECENAAMFDGVKPSALTSI
jgi:hypothetical protein